MFKSSPPPQPSPSVRRALVPCALALSGALAAALAGCARPDHRLAGAAIAHPGSLSGTSAAIAPWQTQASAFVEAVRSLSEPEGELVVATAIAAHEMRRP